MRADEVQAGDKINTLPYLELAEAVSKSVNYANILDKDHLEKAIGTSRTRLAVVKSVRPWNAGREVIIKTDIAAVKVAVDDEITVEEES